MKAHVKISLDTIMDLYPMLGGIKEDLRKKVKSGTDVYQDHMVEHYKKQIEAIDKFFAEVQGG